MRSQLIQQAVQQIIGEARGADAGEQPQAWLRAQRVISELILQAPTDEQLARLAAHDGGCVDLAAGQVERKAA